MFESKTKHSKLLSFNWSALHIINNLTCKFTPTDLPTIILSMFLAKIILHVLADSKFSDIDLPPLMWLAYTTTYLLANLVFKNQPISQGKVKWYHGDTVAFRHVLTHFPKSKIYTLSRLLNNNDQPVLQEYSCPLLILFGITNISPTPNDNIHVNVL